MSFKKWIASFLCLLFFVSVPISIGFSEGNSSEIDGQDDSHYNGDDFDTEERRKEVEQYLEIPELHENTVIYNGVTHPDYRVVITRPDGTEDRPYVNENGQFAFVVFGQDNYEVGDKFKLFMADNEGNPYETELEIQSAVEGMEVIQSEVQAEELEKSIKDNTTIDQPEIGERSIQVSTVGDVDQVFYGLEDDPVTLQRQLEHVGESTFQAFFSDLKSGETIYFYVIASGITTIIETQVPNQSTEMDSHETANQQTLQEQSIKELNELSGIEFKAVLKQNYEFNILLPHPFENHFLHR